MPHSTFYHWKSKHGGMGDSETKHLKDLGVRACSAQENSGQCNAGQSRSEGNAVKKLMKAASRRQAVEHLVGQE
jgi:hypothetical protein